MRISLLAAVGLAFVLAESTGRASADTITATVRPATPAATVDVTFAGRTFQTHVGVTRWSVDSTTLSAAPAGSSIATFRVDPTGTVAAGSQYIYDDVSGAKPMISTSPGRFAVASPARAAATITSVERLYSADYAAATTAGNTRQATAFQLTIWKLFYGGRVHFGGLSPAVRKLVAHYRADARSYGSTMAVDSLKSSVGADARDQLVVFSALKPAATPAVPVPAAAAAGSALLAALAGSARTSRRRPAVV